MLGWLIRLVLQLDTKFCMTKNAGTVPGISLSKKVGGLIIATCGLGGPQYGKEQTAKQPAMLGGTFRGRWVVVLSMDRVAWLFKRCLNDC